MSLRLRGLVPVLLLAAGMTQGVAAEKNAPEGCHWQSIPEIKVVLNVPDGWTFEQVSSGEPLAYEIRPAGEGFDQTGAVYRLEVRLNSDKATVVERAREFVESVRSGAMEAQPLEERHISTLTLYSSFAYLAPPAEDAPQMSVALSSAANSRTGTLYTMRFDIPTGQLEALAPLANLLFRHLSLDDEI